MFKLCLIFLFGACYAYNNGMGRLPTMGWNTWCTDDACGAIDICSETEVQSVETAIVSQGLDKLGYKQVNLDDCWSALNRTADGQLQGNLKTFPSGMKALADFVHNLGLRIGLYTCIGTQTCRDGRPGSYGHYEQDANTLASWGIDYVKADNCHRPANETGKDLYTQFSKALNATGRPMLFSLCNWGDEDVNSWGATVGQSWRFQMDHIPFWTFPPDGAGAGYGQGTSDIIEYMATLHPSTISGHYGYMDPDFLETLFPAEQPVHSMSYIDSRTEYAFWTLWSAPLLIATDIRNMSDQMRFIIANKEVIAIDQDELAQSGERVVNNTDGGQIWYKNLTNGDKALILYNSNWYPEGPAIPITVTWDLIGWNITSAVAVRDLWNQKDVGVFTGKWTQMVGPHDHTYSILHRN